MTAINDYTTTLVSAQDEIDNIYVDLRTVFYNIDNDDKLIILGKF